MVSAAAHDAHAHPTGWRRYVYSTNHKDIGTMYLVLAIIAGIIGGLLSVLMRVELQDPGIQIFHGLAQMVYGIDAGAALDSSNRCGPPPLRDHRRFRPEARILIAILIFNTMGGWLGPLAMGACRSRSSGWVGVRGSVGTRRGFRRGWRTWDSWGGPSSRWCAAPRLATRSRSRFAATGFVCGGATCARSA